METQVITASQARERGRLYYFTGKPCVNGHVDKRHVKTNECHQCKLERKYAAKKRAAALRPPKEPKTPKPRVHTPRDYSPEYLSWKCARARCNNPKAWNYANYGGRGIRMCPQWDDYKVFLQDMGPRPEGTTLDRYPDVNGNYEPGNCRWATPKEQYDNRRM